jgi:hypothetical protein
MKFSTKNFDFTVENINYKLGLPKTIDVDYNLHFGRINWLADIETREYGIKSILSYVTDYEIEIKWSVEKSELSTKDIQKLLSYELGEFIPAEESDNYIEGILRLNPKNYTVNNHIELTGDLLQVNEVIVNFIDNEITIL